MKATRTEPLSDKEASTKTLLGQEIFKSVAIAKLTPSRFAFLDSLRSLASIMVVLQHMDVTAHNLFLGDFGVDTFFLLSSFLLTHGMYTNVKKAMKDQYSLREWMIMVSKYLLRRFFRIYPFFCIFVLSLQVLPFGCRQAFMIPEGFHVVKTLLFEKGYRYYVFWTLPIEITYYMMIPLRWRYSSLPPKLVDFEYGDACFNSLSKFVLREGAPARFVASFGNIYCGIELWDLFLLLQTN